MLRQSRKINFKGALGVTVQKGSGTGTNVIGKMGWQLTCGKVLIR